MTYAGLPRRGRAVQRLVSTELDVPVVATTKTARKALKVVDAGGDEGARRVSAIQHVIRTGTIDIALAISHRNEK